MALTTGLGAPVSGNASEFVPGNALLLPCDDQTSFVPIVAWTLVHVLMFYAYSHWRPSGVRWRSVCWVCGARCLAAFLFGTHQGWQMQLSLLNLLFLAGVAFAEIAPDRPGSPRVGHRVWTIPLSIPGRWSYGLYLVHYSDLVAAAVALTGVAWLAF